MTKTNRPQLRRRTPFVQTRLPDFKVTGHGATDVGLRREVNEDSFLMLPRNGIWIVADGMGGHAGGQVASTLTVETVGRALVRRLAEAERAARKAGTRVNVPLLMEQSVREACNGVFDEAQRRPELTGMGSTVTVMMVYGALAYFGHVGDSRAYLVRDREIHQLTEDHSLVQEQVAAGLITPEQARVSVMRNIITRSIGFEREVKVDTGAVPVAPGDAFVLCSDGLTGHVEDHEILDVVANFDRRRAPRMLIDLANERGGEDNSTVIVASVVGRRGHRRRDDE
jgi:protein phosphatase